MPHQAPSNNKGFALIATISVMVLLVMIALAMLSLSTIEIRQSNYSKHQQQAQANARMALMIALGELQHYAGPDQRVTANASILDSDPDSTQIDDIIYPYALGVWSSSDEHNRHLIQMDKDLNGTDDTFLVDSRTQTDWDRKSHVLRWLISGQHFDPTKKHTGDSVIMGKDDDHDIEVPLVETPNGQFAWRISDNAQRYATTIQNPYSKTAKISLEDGSIAESLAPLQTPIDTIPEFKSIDLNENNKEKILTLNTLELCHDGQNLSSKDRQKLKKNLNCLSLGLLTNTQTGGTRRNLSAFIEEYGNYADKSPQLPGLTQTTPLIARKGFTYTSPTLGLFQDYASLRNEISDHQISPRAEKLSSSALNDRDNNQPAPITTQRTKQGIHPVLTKAAIYPYIAYSREKRIPVYLLFPRVELYNPYNQTIKGGTYLVAITARFKNNRFKCKLTVEREGQEKTFTYKTPATNSNTLLQGGTPFATDRDYVFTLSSPDIAPGETLLFTPESSSGSDTIGSGKLTRFSWPIDGNSHNMRMVASNSPDDLRGYWIPAKEGLQANAEIKDSDNLIKFQIPRPGGVSFRDDDGPGHRMAKLYKVNGQLSSSYIDHRKSNQLELLQAIEAYAYVKGNTYIEGSYDRTYALNTVDEVLGSSIEHEVFRYWWLGFRLLKGNETDATALAADGADHAFPILSQNNIRGAYAHFHPVPYQKEDVTYRRRGGTRFIFGVYGYANGHDSYAYPWTGAAGDSALSTTSHDNSPKRENGVYKMNPFFWNENTESSAMPLIELPDPKLPILSLSALRHTSLSTKQHWPTYIIGSSYAPLYAPRHATAPTMQEYQRMWEDFSVYRAVSAFWENHHGKNTYEDEYDAYDFSYEVNHALYDSHFLTGIGEFNQKFDSSQWPSDAPFPNPRLIPSRYNNATDKEHLTDYHFAAKCLFINGAFNINCTDPEVWALILKSMRGSRVLTQKGIKTAKDSSPYSRMSIPVHGVSKPADSYDPENWTGFRLLSDSQIDELSLLIVEQVKRRGPFISIADFVNRRLTKEYHNEPFGPSSEDHESRLGLTGPLQAAIDDHSMNQHTEDLVNSPEPSFAKIEEDYWRHNPKHRMAQSPGYLDQADILSKIDTIISPRGDTFTITVYGDSKEGSVIKARAWAQAVVQRQYQYTRHTDDPSLSGGDLPETAFEHLSSNLNQRFGRKFKLISFRWLKHQELIAPAS